MRRVKVALVGMSERGTGHEFGLKWWVGFEF